MSSDVAVHQFVLGAGRYSPVTTRAAAYGRQNAGVDAIVGGVRLDAVKRGVSDHVPKLCDGGPCPLHSRSRHHMLAWPQLHGRRMNLTVRECPHGAYHPDPDDIRWSRRELAAHAGECDGCCEPPGQEPA